jgi:hypothetical protein
MGQGVSPGNPRAASRFHLKRVHLCQDVRGALKHWKPYQWRAVARDNKMTVDQVKDAFMNYLLEGKKVIPLHEPCDGFSYENGCPGHEEQHRGGK